MATGVTDRVGLGDRSLRIDQIADPLGEIAIGLTGITHGAIDRADRFVGVGEQPERKVELVDEGLVVRRGVEGDPEEGAVGIFIRLGLITQALGFKRSTRGVGLGIPPQQHPLTPLV
jgi:hypothetical protein